MEAVRDQSSGANATDADDDGDGHGEGEEGARPQARGADGRAWWARFLGNNRWFIGAAVAIVIMVYRVFHMMRHFEELRAKRAARQGLENAMEEPEGGFEEDFDEYDGEF